MLLVFGKRLGLDRNLCCMMKKGQIICIFGAMSPETETHSANSVALKRYMLLR
jgi:hypothetical protein